MMKLSTMKALCRTVDAHGQSAVVDEILRRWQTVDEKVGRERAKMWRASANFVFTFQNSGQNYILRFNHAAEREPAALQAEVDYLNYLLGQGLRVSRPVRSCAGRFVESVETPLGQYHAVAFEALPGKQFEEAGELSPAHL